MSPGEPTSIGTVTLGNGYQYQVHVVNSTTFALSAFLDSGAPTQPGDYLGGTYPIFDAEVGGHAYTSWNSRNMFPIQHKINLCNQVGCHLWLTVAIGATTEYIQYLFDAVGSLTTGLNPGLMCFFEFGNETWNPAFLNSDWITGRASYAIAQGNSQGFVTNDIFEAGQQWYTWQAHEHYLTAKSTLEGIQSGAARSSS